MFKITGFAIIKTVDGDRLSYTLTEKDENERIIRTNIRKSCEVPTSISEYVKKIEEFIKTDI